MVQQPVTPLLFPAFIEEAAQGGFVGGVAREHFIRNGKALGGEHEGDDDLAFFAASPRSRDNLAHGKSRRQKPRRACAGGCAATLIGLQQKGFVGCEPLLEPISNRSVFPMPKWPHAFVTSKQRSLEVAGEAKEGFPSLVGPSARNARQNPLRSVLSTTGRSWPSSARSSKPGMESTQRPVKAFGLLHGCWRGPCALVQQTALFIGQLLATCHFEPAIGHHAGRNHAPGAAADRTDVERDYGDAFSIGRATPLVVGAMAMKARIAVTTPAILARTGALTTSKRLAMDLHHRILRTPPPFGARALRADGAEAFEP